MISRKSPARKPNKFQVTAEALPGAVFFSLTDLRDGCADAMVERRAIDEFRADGVEEALYATLQPLGWSNAEIQRIVDGDDFVTSYGWPASYPASVPAPKPRVSSKRRASAPLISRSVAEQVSDMLAAAGAFEMERA
jgi:hypothetical protein